MLKYISWIVFLFVLGIGAVLIKRSTSTTFNCEYDFKAIKRKLQKCASFFGASLFAVLLVFVNFGAIRDYLFQVLPEQTITSIYAVIKILFGAPSVTYALNSLCIYFVIGSSISAVCAISVYILTQTLLVGVDFRSQASETNYNYIVKHSYFDRISFISLRKIRI